MWPYWTPAIDYRTDYGLQAMELLKEAVKQGYPVGELVLHKFSLNETNEAMETNIHMDGLKIAVVNG